jgi:hypothetical protein
VQALGPDRAVVAAAGNKGMSRPFWPAALDKEVLAVGAVEHNTGKWTRADYSNHGPWVDATARGSNLQSTFTRATTMVAQGSAINPATDPTIAFDGWASWDGTSFATPIAAAMIARTMTRAGIADARLAEDELLYNAPHAPLADFPHAVLLDELEGKPDPMAR